MRKPCCSLLFHVYVMMDVNECRLDFLDESENSKKDHRRNIYEEVIREAIELKKDLGPKREALQMMFEIFHDQMVDHVNENKKRDPQYALTFSKHMNENVGW